MATRRMFSINITDSARFLKMPESAQALYFHLCMHADDDGVVEAFMVMRLVSSNEDNLKILAAKDLVRILNDDHVTYICDFHEHNLLRSDRKKDSLHQELLLQIVPDAHIKPSRQRVDRIGTSQGRQSVGVGKGSIVEVSQVEVSLDDYQKYGFYNHVLLTEKEHKALKKDFPKNLGAMIQNLDEYLQMNQSKSYDDHNLLMRTWERDRKQESEKLPDWSAR